MPSRRLPVYLLLDCSNSISPESMQAIQKGIEMLVADLKRDPVAIDLVHLSIITYGGKAQQICPLTELETFEMPELTAGGDVVLGEALTFLHDCISKDYRRPSATVQADWPPLTFLLIANQPVDQWQSSAKQLQQKLDKGRIVACVVGSKVNIEDLHHVTSAIAKTEDLKPGYFLEYLKWISQSIKSDLAVSQKQGTSPRAY